MGKFPPFIRLIRCFCQKLTDCILVKFCLGSQFCFINLFVLSLKKLFSHGYIESSLLHAGFSSCGVWASHYVVSLVVEWALGVRTQ